jgi:UDPglucose 6-dehydrogenase
VLDKDPRRVRRWNSPHLPIYEPGLVDIVRVSRDGSSARLRDSSIEDIPVDRIPNLFFTTDSQTSLAKADVVMLAVNTPTKTFGVGGGRATNMTTFDAAAKEVALYARPGTIIVEKSTVPCGTAQRVRKMVRSFQDCARYASLT